MITFISAEWGNYQGRAEEYIEKLGAGIARNMLMPHRFECLRLDDSKFPGWFRKLEMFRPGRFTGRVVYLDLDSLVVGPLEALAYRKGAVHLKDWGWANNVHFGGVLVFDAEIEGRRIWDAFTPDVPDRFKDDQLWMTSLNVWEPLPAYLVRSYRYHCSQQVGPPASSSIIACHGAPKPHQIAVEWVQRAWKA